MEVVTPQTAQPTYYGRRHANPWNAICETVSVSRRVEGESWHRRNRVHTGGVFALGTRMARAVRVGGARNEIMSSDTRWIARYPPNCSTSVRGSLQLTSGPWRSER